MRLNNIPVTCEIDGRVYHFKSRAEHRFARYLEWLRCNENIVLWEYEPETFWFEGIKRGCVSYKPDFYTLEIGGRECTQSWYEVKGYMDRKSMTKIKRFRKYYPNNNLIIIDSNWFKRNTPKLKGLVPGWE